MLLHRWKQRIRHHQLQLVPGKPAFSGLENSQNQYEFLLSEHWLITFLYNWASVGVFHRIQRACVCQNTYSFLFFPLPSRRLQAKSALYTSELTPMTNTSSLSVLNHAMFVTPKFDPRLETWRYFLWHSFDSVVACSRYSWEAVNRIISAAGLSLQADPFLLANIY